jgi:hypothetical protein
MALGIVITTLCFDIICFVYNSCDLTLKVRLETDQGGFAPRLTNVATDDYWGRLRLAFLSDGLQS